MPLDAPVTIAALCGMALSHGQHNAKLDIAAQHARIGLVGDSIRKNQLELEEPIVGLPFFRPSGSGGRIPGIPVRWR